MRSGEVAATGGAGADKRLQRVAFVGGEVGGDDFGKGSGRWADTPAGRAASILAQAQAEYQRAARHALDTASADWDTHGQPHAQQLETLIADATSTARHALDVTTAQHAHGPSASRHLSCPN